MNSENIEWVQIFDITEINKHQQGFIIYKVISILYPKKCVEAVTKLTVWKRYNDFKKLYKDMKILHRKYNISDKFPSLCRGTFFKKYDEHSITEKKESALNFLEFIGNHYQLFTSKEFLKFFETSYMPVDHVSGNINSIKADLNLPDDPEFVKNSDDDINSDSDSVSTLSSTNAVDLTSVSDRLARNLTPKTSDSHSLEYINETENNKIVPHIFNDDDFMKDAENFERMGNYVNSYAAYKSALRILKEKDQNENDYDKKRHLKHKIEICSLRAEKLYNMYLAPEVRDLRGKSEAVIKTDSIPKPAISEIYKYNVVRKEDSGMLVVHSDSQKTFYVKVINKTISFSDDDLIIPESIPYMVQLHNFYNCDNSLFLVLEYIQGSKLSDYLKKIRLKYENNETLENFYDKAGDLDIPDDDSEGSFGELVTNYTKHKKSGVACDDFEHITNEEILSISSENHELQIPTTTFHVSESDMNCSRKSSSISTSETESEQIDILQNDVIVKWAAQLVLALEKLHTLGVICRDLRLHNLLINYKGDLTLTYMCNAKEYYGIFINKRDLNLAPEVQGIGPAGEEADWWSFGAIVYEILVGMNLNDLHPDYFHRYTILRVPKYVSPEGRSLLRQLLVHDPKKRLGAGTHGVDNLKAHPFFRSINWDALLAKSVY